MQASGDGNEDPEQAWELRSKAVACGQAGWHIPGGTILRGYRPVERIIRGWEMPPIWLKYPSSAGGPHLWGLQSTTAVMINSTPGEAPTAPAARRGKGASCPLEAKLGAHGRVQEGKGMHREGCLLSPWQDPSARPVEHSKCPVPLLGGKIKDVPKRLKVPEPAVWKQS